MSSMRSLINLVEDAQPPADLLAKITGIVGALKREDFQFSTELVQKAMAAVEAKKAEFDKNVAKDRAYMGAEFNAADWSFDRRDVFLELLPEIIRRSMMSFQVRREASEMERDYQGSMATNRDDLNDFVESSDFLSALSAQRDLGLYIDLHARDLANKAAWGPILSGIEDVLATFGRFDPSQQQVAPRWMRCVHEDLCQILPLMMFMLRNGLA